jgi:hypothetical protein
MSKVKQKALDQKSVPKLRGWLAHAFARPALDSGDLGEAARDLTLSRDHARRMRISEPVCRPAKNAIASSPVPPSAPPCATQAAVFNRNQPNWLAAANPRKTALASHKPRASTEGAYRNRTGVNGFAGRCVATPPRRRRGSKPSGGVRAKLGSPEGRLS